MGILNYKIAFMFGKGSHIIFNKPKISFVFFKFLLLERPIEHSNFHFFSLFLFPILLGWFDPENCGTVVIYIAHEKDQQSRKGYCMQKMQKAVSLLHHTGMRRSATSVT